MNPHPAAGRCIDPVERAARIIATPSRTISGVPLPFISHSSESSCSSVARLKRTHARSTTNASSSMSLSTIATAYPVITLHIH